MSEITSAVFRTSATNCIRFTSVALCSKSDLVAVPSLTKITLYPKATASLVVDSQQAFVNVPVIMRVSIPLLLS